MHLLILLVSVAGGVLTAGLPQYHPPSSPQQYYEAPPTGYAPRRAQGHNPTYTYAEVNTPYYQYHYYSPVYKNYHNQPPLFESSSPESSVSNDVNSYGYGASTTLKNLFNPSNTVQLNSYGSGFQNNGYTPVYHPSIKSFSPTFGNAQDVSITTKPLSVNNAFSPVLRTYQAPTPNKVHHSPLAPISTPTELALVSPSPNIFRERFGNDRNPEDPLTYQGTTFGPDLTVSDNANLNLGFKPKPVPESLATPSSTIIKDDIRRRGISTQLTLRDQTSLSTKKVSLEKYPVNTDTFISNSSPQLSQQSPKPSSLDALSGRISANILRVFSSPNLELPSNLANNTSVVLPTEVVLPNDVSDEDVSTHQDSITQSTPQPSTQIPIDTTVSHRQKIAKKANPTVFPKKFLSKHPNVMFYSPGHDIPN